MFYLLIDDLNMPTISLQHNFFFEKKNEVTLLKIILNGPTQYIKIL